jgi:murein DD-endopeptidase MepM/ murein hydrolase activator NlpD
MTRISFGSPVAGRIRPHGSPFEAGNFRVTAAFNQIDDDHPTAHQGVDVGNGECGAPIHAMADGHVSFIQRSNGNPKVANIVRIQHEFEPHDDVESGYAHLATIATGIAVGVRVTRGHVIGTLGNTGTKLCHLHLGLKVNRIEVDGWPFLEQNQEGEMLKGTNAKRLFNRKGRILHDDTRFRAGPSTSEDILATYAADTEIAPDFVVHGTTVDGSPAWYGTWGNTENGKEFGYIHASLVDELTPIEVVETPIP